MTAFGKKLLETIDKCGIPTAATLLRSAIPVEPLATLAEVRQKEALLRPHTAEERSTLASAYIDGVVNSDASLLPGALNYVAYCERVATVRDQLALLAHNDAEVLAGLPLEQAIELCSIAVSALIRERIMRPPVRAESDTIPSEQKLIVPEGLINTIWDAARLHALLPVMLREVILCARRGAARPPRTLMEALRAAQRLSVVADDWQSLTYVRQSVAWSQEVVARVGPAGRILLDPAHPEAEQRKIANRRRLGLVSAGLKPGRTDHIHGFLMPIIAPLTRSIAEFVGRPDDADDIAKRFLLALGSTVVASDVVIFDFLARDDKVGRTVRVLLSAFFFASLLARERPPGLFRSRLTYLPRWSEHVLYELFAVSSNTDVAFVRGVMASCSWNPASPDALRQPLDLSTTPYIHLTRSRLGITVLPGLAPKPFAETRRVLTSSNRLSNIVGNTYEKYVRIALREAGFSVPEASIKLRQNDRTITDLDAVAYKDDCLIVVQAKHMVEPNSHHAFWKAEQEVMCGIRQCALGMRYLQENPEVVIQHFPESEGALELKMFGLIVTPSLRFTGASCGPISVVDDAYLEHVAYIGEIRTFHVDSDGIDATGTAWRMYEGETPTGPEFIALMKTPEFFRYYAQDDWSLESTSRRVRDLDFIHLVAKDAMSGTDYGVASPPSDRRPNMPLQPTVG